MKLEELEKVLEPETKPCPDCERDSIRERFWRFHMTPAERKLAKSADYTYSRGAGAVCVACDARRRRANPTTALPVPQPYYDSEGNLRPACSNNPEMWFPQKQSNGVGYAQTKAAKAACATCPLREECLEIAMEAEGASALFFRHGIYGGLSPVERHRLARAEGRTGGARLYRTLYCSHGHPKREYWNEKHGLCEACVAISKGDMVRTNAERADLAEMRDLHGELNRVASYSMTGKYAPKKGTGGFTGHGEAFERRRKSA